MALQLVRVGLEPARERAHSLLELRLTASAQRGRASSVFCHLRRHTSLIPRSIRRGSHALGRGRVPVRLTPRLSEQLLKLPLLLLLRHELAPQLRHRRSGVRHVLVRLALGHE